MQKILASDCFSQQDFLSIARTLHFLTLHLLLRGGRADFYYDRLGQVSLNAVTQFVALANPCRRVQSCRGSATADLCGSAVVLDVVWADDHHPGVISENLSAVLRDGVELVGAFQDRGGTVVGELLETYAECLGRESTTTGSSSAASASRLAWLAAHFLDEAFVSRPWLALVEALEEEKPRSVPHVLACARLMDLLTWRSPPSMAETLCGPDKHVIYLCGERGTRLGGCLGRGVEFKREFDDRAATDSVIPRILVKIPHSSGPRGR